MNNPQTMENIVKLEVGQLASLAWKNGLWHSESELTKSLIDYVTNKLKSEQSRLLNEILEKERSEEIYSPLGTQIDYVTVGDIQATAKEWGIELPK